MGRDERWWRRQKERWGEINTGDKTDRWRESQREATEKRR